jgi:hypothetical protein
MRGAYDGGKSKVDVALQDNDSASYYLAGRDLMPRAVLYLGL